MNSEQCNKLNYFKYKINQLAAHIGAVDYAFFFDFKEPENWLGNNWLNSFKSRKSLIFSSAKLELLFCRSRSSMTKLDPDLVKSLNKDHHIWLLEKKLKQQQIKQNLLKEFSYSKQISVSFNLHNFDYLTGGISFFYEGDCHLTDIQRLELINDFITEIESLGAQIAYSRLLISPFEDYQILKPSTISIIQHLSQGCSRSKLSDIHYMSARGVDYHIEKAKLLLEAKNTSHLIHIAHRTMLIE
ncbi:helix-turn-helix transcriptional regulator [Shewanella sp. KT0246]|uniref:helix-turn-helix transcriptional regulator n=1 Tax=Shewanella sp. KT0246 TaxID=2815912 RepID=UPI001BC762B4|nr:helix-turn-helix transcriptional regulator [Shewanella sp. KT0246]GIU48470.1 hypothetical protein TUM4249_03850 [Shewanella sp. KT0246]